MWSQHDRSTDQISGDVWEQCCSVCLLSVRYLVLGSSWFLAVSLSCSHFLCLWYNCIHSIHYSCFLSLILQLRLVRYAVPLAMIGCLYYKVCHFLGGLCSSLYRQSHYGAERICVKCMRKGKWLKWKLWKKMITSNWIITGQWNDFFPCIYFAVGM